MKKFHYKLRTPTGTPFFASLPGRIGRIMIFVITEFRKNIINNILGHANCPPPYPQAGLCGAILYPPPAPTKQGMDFAPRGPLALERKK